MKLTSEASCFRWPARSAQLAYGLRLAVARHGEELGARLVQVGTPASRPRDVDGGQVQRQAQQVVAQRLGDELVDLVACWRVRPRMMALAGALSSRRWR
jgi:hypothetical protein